ncbi:amidohydrolase family protein [Phenylobacterium aquaticum]|nr:amidohydrolase family protein [Phenylobacterium aquaticum]
MTGKTVGGMRLYPPANRLDRESALRLWTEANTWFSNEAGKKGRIAVGQLADLAVLSGDYFSVPEDEIPHLSSVLTLLGGRIVHGEGGFSGLAPALPPPMPDWAPVRTFGGYQGRRAPGSFMTSACACANACQVHGHDHAAGASAPSADPRGFWGALGCGCWAV